MPSQVRNSGYVSHEAVCSVYLLKHYGIPAHNTYIIPLPVRSRRLLGTPVSGLFAHFWLYEDIGAICTFDNRLSPKPLEYGGG
jgi:hypothetical protein